MELWPWAVHAYGRPDVAAAALALQDDHGQCVPLLLWAGWARPDDPDLIGHAVSLARTWEAAAILPLRTARRGLKAGLPGADAASQQALRAQVKASELEAERLLLGALASLGGSGGAALEVALAATATAWGGQVEPAALERLSRTLRGVQ
ncbi:MAG: TIGR02444 family protein [Phenylobacterium sp.]|uniref:TIGR02444 family protein n=1 Tax=Phenylobacterium sp. TaxID=1871053 RepID=UPI0025DDE0AC|nr:TIGR02444 family protein [Phenylobacterium sp.]MCG9915301.1 TIGR02444 family protein [Phenylobacterium sp.]